MPDLIRLETDAFELNIWCSSIEKRRQQYLKTKLLRQQNSTANLAVETSILISELPESLIIESQPVKISLENPQVIVLPQPLFFENLQYQFEWIFKNEVTAASLRHELQSVNTGFRFSPARSRIPARLCGTLNTGNDLGWLTLPLEFILHDRRINWSMSFEVLPVKMDLHQDLPAMYRVIDQSYPLWRFSFAQKTAQSAGSRRKASDFSLFWLAHFKNIREQLFKALKIIDQAPHSRLQAVQSKVKADQIKCKVSPRMSAKIEEDLAAGKKTNRYSIQKRYLNLDTPENRFIKMVVQRCKKTLNSFERKLLQYQLTHDSLKISESFIHEIQCWQNPLEKYLNFSFLKEVGFYSGQTSESLVLQQKTGYGQVYRLWQILRTYLDLFDGQSRISMKSVAQIYEIWCFLEIKRLLVEELGFTEQQISKAHLKRSDLGEVQMKDGLGGAFRLTRDDGVSIRLAHEPEFRANSRMIKSYTVAQKPDIVMEIFKNGQDQQKMIWLFDAKYRIKDQDYSQQHCDFVPDDAINQMHRYRDALIQVSKIPLTVFNTKSRPVLGAFALYPGMFEQETMPNPYNESIAEAGIGAFALLPGKGNEGSYWLLQFLREQLSTSSSLAYSSDVLYENTKVQEAARISYTGMKQVLYSDLVLTAALGGQKGRDPSYFKGFENGTAQWYHTRVDTFPEKYKQYLACEIRYLALAMTDKQNTATKCIQTIWPVKNVKVLPRSALSVQQAGKVAPDDQSLCYLFELGKPLTLKDAIRSVPHRPFKNSMKLTRLEYFDQTLVFKNLQQVYLQALG